MKVRNWIIAVFLGLPLAAQAIVMRALSTRGAVQCRPMGREVDVSTPGRGDTVALRFKVQSYLRSGLLAGLHGNGGFRCARELQGPPKSDPTVTIPRV